MLMEERARHSSRLFRSHPYHAAADIRQQHQMQQQYALNLLKSTHMGARSKWQEA